MPVRPIGSRQAFSMGWLSAEFTRPVRVPVPGGYHLRPVRAADTDLDYPAVMGSQQRL
jgi:hypothetical protein